MASSIPNTPVSSVLFCSANANERLHASVSHHHCSSHGWPWYSHTQAAWQRYCCDRQATKFRVLSSFQKNSKQEESDGGECGRFGSYFIKRCRLIYSSRYESRSRCTMPMRDAKFLLQRAPGQIQLSRRLAGREYVFLNTCPYLLDSLTSFKTLKL